MLLPKQKMNEKGEIRKVGFEFEYSDVPLEETANMVQNMFGGKIKCEHATVYEVNGTEFGDFKIELDALPIQKISEKNKNISSKSNVDKLETFQVRIGEKIEEASTFFTPFEIVTPPIPVDEMDAVLKLEDQLKNSGAKGTKSSFQYAFGLHINPEVSSLKVESIVQHMQAFLLLEEWLKKEHDIDLSRKLTNFIDPFPKDYLKLVLDEDYKPNMETFIQDYHRLNPSRNRSLDLTPLLAFVDEDLVRKLYGEDEKINKRPTYHYRLPNCEIGQKHWSVEQEWETWLKVESLAENEKGLKHLIKKWHEHEDKLFSMTSTWVETVQKFIDEYEI